jgi:hypothetical protein
MKWIELAQNCGNELSRSMKCEKFVDWLKTGWPLKMDSPSRSKKVDEVINVK